MAPAPEILPIAFPSLPHARTRENPVYFAELSAYYDCCQVEPSNCKTSTDENKHREIQDWFLEDEVSKMLMESVGSSAPIGHRKITPYRPAEYHVVVAAVDLFPGDVLCVEHLTLSETSSDLSGYNPITGPFRMELELIGRVVALDISRGEKITGEFLLPLRPEQKTRKLAEFWRSSSSSSRQAIQ